MGLIRSVTTVGGLHHGQPRAGVLARRAVGARARCRRPRRRLFRRAALAQCLPRLVRRGRFQCRLRPAFSRRLEGEGLPAATRFAEEALSVLLTFLLLFTLAAQAGMPWFIYVIAAGFAEKPEKLALAILLTQITFPYLVFISLTALQGGILNSLYRFGHAAAAPIVLNLVMIVALVFVRR